MLCPGPQPARIFAGLVDSNWEARPSSNFRRPSGLELGRPACDSAHHVNSGLYTGGRRPEHNRLGLFRNHPDQRPNGETVSHQHQCPRSAPVGHDRCNSPESGLEHLDPCPEREPTSFRPGQRPLGKLCLCSGTRVRTRSGPHARHGCGRPRLGRFLCASLVVEVPLRLTVVEPEAGRVPAEAGRSVAMANQRNVAALDAGASQASLESSAGKAGTITREMVSAASENPTSVARLGKDRAWKRPRFGRGLCHHGIGSKLKRAWQRVNGCVWIQELSHDRKAKHAHSRRLKARRVSSLDDLVGSDQDGLRDDDVDHALEPGSAHPGRSVVCYGLYRSRFLGHSRGISP